MAIAVGLDRHHPVLDRRLAVEGFDGGREARDRQLAGVQERGMPYDFAHCNSKYGLGVSPAGWIRVLPASWQASEKSLSPPVPPRARAPPAPRRARRGGRASAAGPRRARDTRARRGSPSESRLDGGRGSLACCPSTPG